MPFSIIFPTTALFKRSVNALKDIIKDGIFYLEYEGYEQNN